MPGQMYKGGWISAEPGWPPALADLPCICGDESVPQSCVCRRAGGRQPAAKHPSLWDPGPPDPQGSLTEAPRGVYLFTNFAFSPLKDKWQAAGVFQVFVLLKRENLELPLEKQPGLG